MQASHKMKVGGEGNQQAKMPATDLNINFRHVPDAAGTNGSRFERKGKDANHLIYRHKLTLNDALQCRPVKIETLDGRTLLIAVDQILSPGSLKLIAGEGMVSRDDTCVGTIGAGEKRGDLYVLFDIEFPKRLPGTHKRQELVDALAPAVGN